MSSSRPEWTQQVLRECFFIWTSNPLSNRTCAGIRQSWPSLRVSSRSGSGPEVFIFSGLCSSFPAGPAERLHLVCGSVQPEPGPNELLLHPENMQMERADGVCFWWKNTNHRRHDTFLIFLMNVMLQKEEGLMTGRNELFSTHRLAGFSLLSRLKTLGHKSVPGRLGAGARSGAEQDRSGPGQSQHRLCSHGPKWLNQRRSTDTTLTQIYVLLLKCLHQSDCAEHSQNNIYIMLLIYYYYYHY